MNRQTLEKKIIHEKPPGIQRQIQKFIFYLGSTSTKKKINKSKIVPQTYTNNTK